MDLTEVLTFIAEKATSADIGRIHDATAARIRALRAIRAAAVQTGQQVVLDGIKPKALAGLRGTVARIDGRYADVELDEASTETLRWSRTRVFVPEGVTRYVLTGIPLSCCLPVDTSG